MVELRKKSTKILQAMLFCGILMIFAATAQAALPVNCSFCHALPAPAPGGSTGYSFPNVNLCSVTFNAVKRVTMSSFTSGVVSVAQIDAEVAAQCAAPTTVPPTTVPPTTVPPTTVPPTTVPPTTVPPTTVPPTTVPPTTVPPTTVPPTTVPPTTVPPTTVPPTTVPPTTVPPTTVPPTTVPPTTVPPTTTTTTVVVTTTTAPPTTTTTTLPPAPPTSGEALYNSYGCAMCHGAGGSGTPAIDPLAETGAEEIYNVSRRGPCEPDLAKLGLPTCMPKYNLSMDDSKAISKYLRGR